MLTYNVYKGWQIIPTLRAKNYLILFSFFYHEPLNKNKFQKLLQLPNISVTPCKYYTYTNIFLFIH